MEQMSVKVEKITKVFKLPHEKTTSIKSAVVGFYRRRKGYELQEALKDVSFEVKKGEFFGIVGRNGSGKSTLLKLMAGIYEPNQGRISVDGSLTPFIELGVGFNPELTGRENVYLNGALLGFNRKEMRAMYKDIVEFAELGKFMDQKLKNYSSGMQVRLAFSIAIRAKSDILLLDEVLAVGDAAFQRKCYEVFKDLKRRGITVVLVTHDMNNVEKFCDRVLVMDEGKVLDIASPGEAISKYSKLNIEDRGSIGETKRWGSKEVAVAKVYTPGKKTLENIYDYGAPMEIVIELKRKSSHKDIPVVVGLGFVNEDGISVAGPNSSGHSELNRGSKFKYVLPEINLAPGNYKLTISIYDTEFTTPYDFLNCYYDFNIVSDKMVYGLVSLNGKWE